MDQTIVPPTHDEIASLARHFWEDDGRPAGKAEEHWKKAEKALRERPPKELQTEHRNFL